MEVTLNGSETKMIIQALSAHFGRYEKYVDKIITKLERSEKKQKKNDEAREIIKDLLDILFINDCAVPSNSKKRAEQFLGEEK